MKQNIQSGIEVRSNQGLDKTLFKIFSGSEAPEVVIETGTYLGTGTTRLLIDAIEKSSKESSVLFYTIESNKERYKAAAKNLPHSWVQQFHALSINPQDCVEWIKTDPYIANHSDYPDLLIDDVTDPVKHYTSDFDPEVLGFILDENMLSSLIENFSTENIFFCLDSCGGIGYLEFKTVNSLMDDRGFYLFVDGVNHLKHVRSAEEIQANTDGRWAIEYQDDQVMVAKRLPKV
jgi:hypothetical protein